MDQDEASGEAVRIATMGCKRKRDWDEVDSPSREYGNGYDDSDDQMIFVRGASPTSRRPQSPPAVHRKSAVCDRERSYEDLLDSYASDQLRGCGGGADGAGLPPKRRKEDSHGKCRKKKKKKLHGGRSKHRHLPQSSTSNTICMFFMKGSCHKGADCTYSHSALPFRKMELCKFFLMDCCSKRERCLYMHGDFPCKFFHQGLKCFSGPNCKFSHGPLTEASRAALLKHLESNGEEVKGDLQLYMDNVRNPRSRSCDDARAATTTSPPQPHLPPAPRRGSCRSPAHRNGEGDVPCNGHDGNRDKPTLMFYQDTLGDDDIKDRKRAKRSHKVMCSLSNPTTADDARSRDDCFAMDVSGVEDDDGRHWESGTDGAVLAGLPSAGTGIPSSIPRKQRELLVRLQQHNQHVARSVQDEDGHEGHEHHGSHHWSSSDEDEGCMSSVLQRLAKEAQPSDSNGADSVNRLLSTIRTQLSGDPAGGRSPPLRHGDANVPRDPRNRSRPCPLLSVTAGEGDPALESRRNSIDVYSSAIVTACHSPLANGAAAADEFNLPFKPAPMHRPATEIYAAVTSHPPMVYQLLPVTVPAPDYTKLRFRSTDPQVHLDPRLRKVYRLADASAPTSRPDPRRRHQ